MISVLRNLSLRGLHVWARNRDVYLITWKTNLIPPMIEPILYLLAFGAGVGALVKQVVYRGDPVGYAMFIAPGLLATQVMFQSFFETTYNTFVRMYYQKTFDGMITTPLTIEDVMLGELLWGATKGAFNCAIMMVAITFFGLLTYPTSLIIIPFSVLAGFVFAGMGLCFTAITPRIDMFNFSTFLLIMPMFLFSGTFFPLDVLPSWAQAIAYCLPLTHVTIFMREASFGHFTSAAIGNLIYLGVISLPLGLCGIYLMKRRLIK